MDKHKREQLIEEYGRGYDNLMACLDEIPQEMRQFKSEPKEWSVHEILVHLADSETNSALRARLLISQPGKTVMAYDQDLWAIDQDYHSQSWQDALTGLKWARTTTYALVKKQPEEVWSHAVVHPEFDTPYTLERWLEIYAAHVPGHIEQIKNNYKIWQERQ
jgi:hypothetical protein